MSKTTNEQRMGNTYKNFKDALNTTYDNPLNSDQIFALGEAFIATRNSLEAKGETAKATQVDDSISELTNICELVEATKGGKIPAGELRKKLLASEELKPVLAIIQEENKDFGPLIDPKTKDQDRLAAIRTTADIRATVTEGQGTMIRTKSEPSLTSASLVETMKRSNSTPSLTPTTPKPAGFKKDTGLGR